MNRRSATMITGAVLLVGLAIGGAFLPVPYVALGPGPTLDTLGADTGGTEIIQITGARERPDTGHLNLTTVSVHDGLDLLSAFKDWVDGRHSVVPREEVYPPGQSQEEFDQRTTKEFTESQSSAEFAALGELNYPVQVLIKEIPDGSPSKGKLAVGDVLRAVNNVPVTDYEDVAKQLSGLKPGATVTVRYTRGGRDSTVPIVTTKATEREGAAIGVFLDQRRDAPFTVKIALDESIGGPSAGLMFALGILQKVGPDDLTGGRFIAGTGTIDTDGKVGPIGGIQLKMIAAKDRGAIIFLVPADNCTDALASPPAGLQLIKVDNLHGAVQALKASQLGQPTPGC
jgi:PDZ domain-containing protein